MDGVGLMEIKLLLTEVQLFRELSLFWYLITFDVIAFVQSTLPTVLMALSQTMHTYCG